MKFNSKNRNPNNRGLPHESIIKVVDELAEV
jgi:hypothetical protein